MLFHERQLLRVTTRMSTTNAGIHTILRGITRAPIPFLMGNGTTIDLEKLKADMTAEVERTSGRSFSLAATNNRNPDFYRNFINNGQDKRMSAEVFIGIVSALKKNPADYVIGMPHEATLPSATVLTSAFALLLETVGIDPYQDERAQKLAKQFPNALQRVSDLRAGLIEDSGSVPAEDAPDRDEGRLST